MANAASQDDRVADDGVAKDWAIFLAVGQAAFNHSKLTPIVNYLSRPGSIEERLEWWEHAKQRTGPEWDAVRFYFIKYMYLS